MEAGQKGEPSEQVPLFPGLLDPPTGLEVGVKRHRFIALRLITDKVDWVSDGETLRAVVRWENSELDTTDLQVSAGNAFQ